MYLISLRHGQAEKDTLTFHGEASIDRSIEKILSFKADWGKVAIITSPAGRADQSGERFATRFNVPRTIDKRLGNKEGDSNLYDALEVIKDHQQGVDTLILITHADAASSLPFYYFEQGYKNHDLFTLTRSGNFGYVSIVDFDARTVTVI